MTARRWIGAVLVAVATATAACAGGSNPLASGDDGRFMPPVEPTDTSGFIPGP
jgi:hypothetical protein